MAAEPFASEGEFEEALCDFMEEHAISFGGNKLKSLKEFPLFMNDWRIYSTTKRNQEFFDILTERSLRLGVAEERIIYFEEQALKFSAEKGLAAIKVYQHIEDRMQPRNIPMDFIE